jgi:hypothetical protein
VVGDGNCGTLTKIQHAAYTHFTSLRGAPDTLGFKIPTWQAKYSVLRASDSCVVSETEDASMYTCWSPVGKMGDLTLDAQQIWSDIRTCIPELSWRELVRGDDCTTAGLLAGGRCQRNLVSPDKHEFTAAVELDRSKHPFLRFSVIAWTR